MELGDLLVKIAQKKDLNSEELEYLRQQGNQIQPAVDKVTKWAKSGGDSITADTVYARYGNFEYPPSGIGIRLVRYSTSQPITTSLTSSISFTGVMYNDGFVYNPVIDDTKIYVPITGKYGITQMVSWATATGGQRLSMVFVNGNNVAIWNDDWPSTNRTARTAVYDEISLVKEDYIQLKVWQSSGGDLNAKAAIAVRMIRKNDTETTLY